jgi:hypothetical protein
MRHREVGVLEYDSSRAQRGVTIITPMHGHASYLIGMRGEVLHEWQFPLQAGMYGQLLPGGNILWAGRTKDGPSPGGGKGGLIRECDWDGKIVWEYQDDAQHHDLRRLRNGNTLYIGWEPMPAEAARRVVGAEAGSEAKGGIIWGDYLREVTPAGATAWEWHAHSDMKLEQFPLHPMSTRAEFAHCNACAELTNGDIMLSFRKISTIAIVDKKTRKLRWHKRDDDWGQQHDCEMLPNGNVLFFANGIHVPRGVFHSRAIEFDPSTGETIWSYQGSPPESFFIPNISGCQRQPNANTMICEGMFGRIFEVTPEGRIVWEYISPYFGDSPRPGGGKSNAVFRAYRYAPDGPELQGRLGSA